MRRKNIPFIDELVGREFADKLRRNGFHPYKDNTEWIRLVNGEIVQIVLFYEYHYWLEVFFYSELTSEFLRIGYRDHRHMDKVVGTDYCNVRKRFGEDVYAVKDVFAAGAAQLPEKIELLHKHLDMVIDALNAVKFPSDIIFLDPNERHEPKRICLHYASGDHELLQRALFNAAQLDPVSYSEDTPPARPQRDYWKVWQVRSAFVARSILQGGSMNKLKHYAEECRRYNLKYLKKHLPELFEV